MAKKKEITKQEVPESIGTPIYDPEKPLNVPSIVVDNIDTEVTYPTWDFTSDKLIGRYVKSRETDYLFKEVQTRTIFAVQGHSTITRALEILDFNTEIVMELDPLHTDQGILYGFKISAE